jgi:hypothetical protein
MHRYHKIRVRGRRKELRREFEVMLVEEPEKASEKLDELQRDRVYERGTLKHRGAGGRWSKALL